MPEKCLPKYPIYIPSKGRWSKCYTADFLINDGVPFKLVVEPDEAPKYSAVYGKDNLILLPNNNNGSVIPARNFIKQLSTKNGDQRHWQLDDNIREIRRMIDGKGIPCSAGVGLRVCEDFADRYKNVAIAGLNYYMFAGVSKPPFYLNVHVYSCTLVLNSIPYQWRGRYNEDTDICLQVLSGGWCTILINAFVAHKIRTMTIKGGNTDALYNGDGRLKMARSLERVWPKAVKTGRRFKRPQHVVFDAWRRFDNKLQLRDDFTLEDQSINEYGLKAKQMAPDIKSDWLKSLVDKE